MEEKIIESQKKSFGQKWQILIENIVRPPRKTYNIEEVKDSSFVMNGKVYTKQQYNVDHQGKQIQLSIYSLSKENSTVILYLHSNSSNKFQALTLINFLPDAYSLACFDFFACGRNQMAKTISLGLRQAKQTASVVDFLKKRGSNVVIWGRSMGAATALIYGKVQIIVSDSVFMSFRDASKQISQKFMPPLLRPILSCFFCCIYAKLRSDVQKKGDYDVEDLNLMKAIDKIDPSTLIIFIAGDNDEIVSNSHSSALYKRFKGEKYYEIFEGGHNSRRPEYLYKRLFSMIGKNIERRKQQYKKNISFDSFSFELSQTGRKVTK